MKKKPQENFYGAVMVVGGGIAGIQAALDLADSGFLVHMVEKSPAIGGVMSALDKTFPTNDCSMCILSPKLVEVGRHRNIRLLTLSEVESIEGEPGRFTVTVRERPRYVDTDKCIACGVCADKCPRKVEDAYNQGLGTRKAAYVLYPQAVPLKYAIDADHCIYFEKGKCRACEKFCPAGAIDFNQKEKVHQIDVGSIILAPGFTSFDPSGMDVYGYGRLPNVVTSMQFERILNASGPFEGHLTRPSDHKAPAKIAWLQCVGSRDMHEGANPYCSGVCCMYAIKEALVAREHAGGDLETAIFFMDMRTHGKGFEQTYMRARDEEGVRFIRSRVHSIEPAGPGSDDLSIHYVTENGEIRDEVFDLVVLSTGLEISPEIRELASKLDIDLDRDGFASTSSFQPVATSRPGIFSCGAFAGVKDIPQSVMEASAAYSASAALLSPARNTLTTEKSYPPEKSVADEEPRVGVFVCHCGINIGGVVDVPAVREYAKTLPNVVYAGDNLFTCSQDTQENIRKTIQEHRLNRVVVAACTPRTHEPLFQETIREAGLNPYLFEFANIRDQDSWVHQKEPERATTKAKDLVRMAVAKASLLEPIDRLQLEVNHNALVIGAGVAGMAAALNLADQGFHTFLVERSGVLGGQANNVRTTWNGESVPDFIADLTRRIQAHDRIDLLLEADIQDISGFVGNFTTKVKQPSGEKTLEHGVVIVATGGVPCSPQEYLNGESDRVTVWHELEQLFEKEPERLAACDGVAFIQCVGSREPERPYCSKLCCTASIQQAIALKKARPDLDVTVLYRDIRTFGQREDLYREARERGVLFIRFSVDQKPTVEKVDKDGKKMLRIGVTDPILGRPIHLYVDYLNLATAIVPRPVEDLAKMLKVPLNEDGFFLEAHIKLRPVDFSTDGVFVCGLAHYPKPIEESIAQAQAAAGRAARLLSQETIDVEPIVSVVDQDLCIGCGLCEASCPFGAIRLVEVPGKGYRAENISALCKGCGVCAAACPQKAIDMKHFRDRQIRAAIRAGAERI
ncbi:MAG: CoB--CoM heterodisulfide reductase iron-sulfur subunit A family protein [Deltaproteobacteria bacterium]|nr:CoB--CoM heterodisulfide reductase iron-sulfur subunit A family protein [Deltaproteobacteria bacterium]